MPTATSLEKDLDRARRIAEDRLILRVTVGSIVHGLSNPGTDDRDEMGVCVEPPEYLLGFRRFEHFVHRTQPEGAPSGPGDLDLVVYGLRKYCHLALKGSPTVLLPLFVPDQGAELLTSGRITLPVAEPERGALREVRAGAVPLDEVLRRLDAATARLEDAARSADLPAKPDAGAIDAFLVRAYRRTWDAD